MLTNGNYSGAIDQRVMSYGIDREDALTLLKEHIRNQKMIKHCLASEAVMVALAEKPSPG